ncbi:MAG: glycosyltransferase family 92 protein [Helicobacteraceae bacterium]|nr:glycosyltransferase family 92 protein [Helicobacteraceae bacterium]
MKNVVRYGFFNYLTALKKEDSLVTPNYLAICAIAKDEGVYFKEWIEYHLLVGAQKFYIYDNESSDDTKNVLQPYIDRGIVEYIYFPGKYMQLPAYKDCLTRYRFDSKWIAFIDIDEFIVPITENSIPDFLKKLPRNTSQLFIAWVFYGSNGHKTKPSGGVIESYRRRAAKSFKIGKSIVNPRLIVKNTADPHVFRDTPFCIRDENMKIVENIIGSNFQSTARKIRINHYAVKFYEEYKWRKMRGDVSKEQGEKLCSRPEIIDELFNDRDRNEIYDDFMDKFIAQLSEKLAN